MAPKNVRYFKLDTFGKKKSLQHVYINQMKIVAGESNKSANY